MIELDGYSMNHMWIDTHEVLRCGCSELAIAHYSPRSISEDIVECRTCGAAWQRFGGNLFDYLGEVL